MVEPTSDNVRGVARPFLSGDKDAELTTQNTYCKSTRKCRATMKSFKPGNFLIVKISLMTFRKIDIFVIFSEVGIFFSYIDPSSKRGA